MEIETLVNSSGTQPLRGTTFRKSTGAGGEVMIDYIQASKDRGRGRVGLGEGAAVQVCEPAQERRALAVPGAAKRCFDTCCRDSVEASERFALRASRRACSSQSRRALYAQVCGRPDAPTCPADPHVPRHRKPEGSPRGWPPPAPTPPRAQGQPTRVTSVGAGAAGCHVGVGTDLQSLYIEYAP